MSLYDGVFDDCATVKSEKDTKFDFLKSQLKARRLNNSERSAQIRQNVAPAPVIDFASRKRGRNFPQAQQISFNSLTGKMEVASIDNRKTLSSRLTSYYDSPLRNAPYCTNEYEPMRPNDYQDIKERRRMEAIRKKQEEIIKLHNLRPDPPVTSEESQQPQVGPAVISKIMAKMGYKEGQGLGKTNQGMSQALSVEKTSRRCGKIINSDQQINNDSDLMLDVMRNPSKVVLLRNMVTHGQVDNELESETSEECSKYGKVKKVVIFEIPDATDEDAVRIFVEFEKIDSATKAVVDLNGRFFGGRTVKACFYNLDKFRQYMLGDDV